MYKKATHVRSGATVYVLDQDGDRFTVAREGGYAYTVRREDLRFPVSLAKAPAPLALTDLQEAWLREALFQTDEQVFEGELRVALADLKAKLNAHDRSAKRAVDAVQATRPAYANVSLDYVKVARR